MTLELDRFDLKIMRELQIDARLSNAELAKRVALSPSSCHRRTQRLFENGAITRATAVIDPEMVDRGTLVIVGVVLERSTPESFAAFEEAARELPFLLDVHLVAGEFDYFLKVRVADIADFKRLHGEILIALPGLRQTRTFFVMKEVKDAGPLHF